MRSFTLKEGLLLGSATAATQIEGGDENNNWARFAAEGKVKDGDTVCMIAAGIGYTWAANIIQWG